MASANRTRQHQITMHLQAASSTHEVKLLQEWITLLLDEAKHNLVTSAPNELIRQQGEAQAYQKMLGQLNRPSLMPKPSEDAAYG